MKSILGCLLAIFIIEVIREFCVSFGIQFNFYGCIAILALYRTYKEK